MRELEITDDERDLAGAMIELERRMLAERPERVVLRSDGDAALAAAVVAAKLEIPIAHAPPEAAAGPAQALNRHLIALLAEAPPIPRLTTR